MVVSAVVGESTIKLVSSSSSSNGYWNDDSPKSVAHAGELKSGKVAAVEAIVENQSSNTMWNWGVMYPVEGLRTMGTVLACLLDSPMFTQRVERGFQCGSFLPSAMVLSRT